MKTRFILFKTLFILIITCVKLQAQTSLLDTSFIIGSGFNDEVNTIAIQSDGKILVGGKFTNYNGITRNRITRLNSDGTLDIDFNIGIGCNNVITAISLQPDGKILVSGSFTNYNGTQRNAIVRLNTDGSLDSNFNNDITAILSNINTFAIQPDGKIIVGGSFYTIYGGSFQKRIARLNTDGSLDTSFIGDFSEGSINSIAIQSNGKVLAGGTLTRYHNLASANSVYVRELVRLNTDGSLDSSFVIRDGFTSVSFEKIIIQPDGKILVGGKFNNAGYNNAITRLNNDGSLDIPFNNKTEQNSLFYNTDGYIPNINAIALQPDGKILLSGRYLKNSPIIRLNDDGSRHSYIQTSPPGNPLNDIFTDYYFNTITLQPDGKILLGGHFNSYNMQPRKNILRLLNTTLSVIDITKTEIEIHPNPARDLLSFSDVVSNIEIQDFSGKSVIKYPNSSIKLNLSKLSKGIYFISGIDKAGNQFTKKIIKE